MTPTERHAFEQIVALLRASARLEAVAIAVDDGTGELATLLALLGGVDRGDGYIQTTRGCVTVAARRKP